MQRKTTNKFERSPEGKNLFSDWAPSILLGLLSLTLGMATGQSLTAQEEREELRVEREVYSKTFDNLDGTMTYHSGLEPLHYLDPEHPEEVGSYLDIDPTLIQEEGWRNEANSFPSHLPEMLGDGGAIELGPELGIRWQPRALVARTTSGVDVELGSVAPSWGERSEEIANAVVYRDLFPGLDLMVEVRRGSLNLTTLFREWLFEIAPEQIEFLYIEASLEVDPSLFQAVEERANAGEPFEEIPLYFGRGEDDYVIGLFGHSGVSDTQLEDYADSLRKDEESEEHPGPDGWRSNTYELLSSGMIHHFFRHPWSNTLEPSGGLGTTSAALTAAFKLTWQDSMKKKRYFSSTYKPSLFDSKDGATWHAVAYRCGFFGPCREIPNYMLAAKADGYYYRTMVLFRDMKAFRQELAADPSLEVVDVELGRSPGTFLPPGVAGRSKDEIIAYSAVPYLSHEGNAWQVDFKNPTVFPDPYNEYLRSVTGGSLKTSTWSSHSTQSSIKTIGGRAFHFGSLSNKRAGASIPRAVEDFRYLVADKGSFMMFFLAMAYDRTPCPACTANHHDPAVQALNGEYRVGAGFYDLRLEVTTRRTGTDRSATISATSVGGHNDELYPGETRAWDLKLTSLTGPPDVVELNHVHWSSTSGLYVWFTDIATGQAVNSPSLASVGDKIRIHAEWRRADPSLYGKTKKLEILGWFRNAKALGGGNVEIPIRLKAPEAQPTFNQIYPLFDDNVSAPMGLAWIQLPSQGRRATTFASSTLDWVSGPISKLVKGQHWDVWSDAFPGNDGEVVIYPDQFKPGTYEVDLTPCLWPDGWVSAFHCLETRKQRITFDIRAAAPPNYPPSIDFIAPWSIDSPSGGPVIVAIEGLHLEGADPHTKVKIPQLLALTTPRTGSTDTRASVRVQTASTQICGPRNLSIITTDGTDTAIFNVTKPFSGNPNHFVVEAEAGYQSGLSVQTFANASNGKAVVRSTAGNSGKLGFPFQVPASSSYQIDALYGTAKQAGTRAEIEILEVDPVTGNRLTVKKFIHGLAAVPADQFNLRPIFDSAQVGPPSTFSLQAGKHYRLEIATVSGRDFPIFDLLVFTDGSLGPKLAEICR